MRRLAVMLVVLAACTSTRQPVDTLEPLRPSTSSSTTSTTTTIAVALRSGTGEVGSGEGSCPMWHDMAISAGWSEAEWPTVSRIMYAESACDPRAYSPVDTQYGNGAGLMQIMDQLWPEHCAMAPADLFSPYSNLACARLVYEVQGFEAWSTF